MADKIKKDAKRTDSPLVDRSAYKACVQQKKAQHASNPWTMCNAQFGIDKSEDECKCEKCKMTKRDIPCGMSFKRLEKKEGEWKSKAALRPDKVNEVAPNVYMKKPRQIPKAFVKADEKIKDWKVNSTPEPQDLIDAVSQDDKDKHIEDEQQARAAAIFGFTIQPGMSYNKLKKLESK